MASGSTHGGVSPIFQFLIALPLLALLTFFVVRYLYRAWQRRR